MNEALKPESVESNNSLVDLHEQAVSTLVREFPDTVDEIAQLQERKEAIRDRLQADLDRLADEGIVGDPETMRGITWQSRKKRYMVYDHAGDRQFVERGALEVSSTLWGESHYLGEKIPTDVKEEYLRTQAQFRIDELYDQQVITAEVARWRETNPDRSATYDVIRGQFEGTAELQNGHIAEKMVESLLTKLSFAHDAAYDVKRVSAVDDVENKIDFILQLKSSGGAFGVGVTDAPEIGVQFTTATSEEKVSFKKAQIGRAKNQLAHETESSVSDIVLVQVPLDDARDTFNQWQEQDLRFRKPGGPDQLWSEETREEIKRLVLQAIAAAELEAAA